MPYDHTRVERKNLAFWKANHTFAKSIRQRAKARDFIFYEGPPTANGRPGIHHVLARAFKDVVCRYKTMRGFRVLRKAGWDTHGLPVELEVEKKLGLKTKQDIERYGVEKFNALAKKSVWTYLRDWEKLTERIGFWLDMEHPYITYDPLYMESLFWIIKQLYEKGLLYEGHKVVPWCPRCGTGLSSHEVALGYKDVTEDSVYVKFELRAPLSALRFPQGAFSAHSSGLKVYILAWTTTPWTLPGNVALAVGKNIQYAAVRQGDEIFIVAKDRVSILDGAREILGEFSGKELEGAEYEPLFDSLKDTKEKKYFVAPADFVSVEEGTGIVHTAVMYGEDDYKLGETLRLPKVHTVKEDGTFNERVPRWEGRFVKDKEVEREIIEDLRARGLLYKVEKYRHSYPFCWRCATPLLYYARRSWFVAMSRLRGELQKNNDRINWIPPHLKKGRFGEWLREVKDWAFSRERYWGTPLPVWRCEEGHIEVIGSRKNMETKTAGKNTYIIMRHGEYWGNREGFVSSWPERQGKKLGLTPRGRREVREAIQKLKKEKVDLIVSSDLVRTKETAQMVGKGLGVPVVFDARIREIDTGIFNGRSIQEYHEMFEKREYRFSKRPQGGEHFFDVKKRMIRFINALEKKYRQNRKTILIISHELPLTMLESAMRGFTKEETVTFRKRKAIRTGEFRKISYARFPFNRQGEIDFHKPFIDRIEFPCERCGKPMRRVPEVVDVWFDSGAMPFAQAHFPFCKGIARKSEIRNPKSEILFPADYICEAIDQTRGWFYSLLAVSTALGFGEPYKNVISLAHVLDEKGEKMSKSKGNVVDPWAVLERTGADAVRWYFFTVNAPGEPKLFARKDVEMAQRKFLGILWNAFEFFEMYAEKSKVQSPKAKLQKKSHAFRFSHVLDRWVIALLHQLIEDITDKMERYDITGAARAIESFVVEDLSQWYIRRSRRRFQKPESVQEKRDAEGTLFYVLCEIAKLCAPFVPFLSEEIYKKLTGFESVHLADWPKAERRRIDKELLKEMDFVRKIVSAGLKARAKAGMKVRQPLATLKFSILNFQFSNSALLGLIEEELNVKNVAQVSKVGNERGWIVESDEDLVVGLDTTLSPALKEEGIVREIIRNIQDMRKEAGYKPHHRIQVYIKGEGTLGELLSRWQEMLTKETLVSEVRERPQRRERFDRERNLVFDAQNLWVGIRRI